MHISEYIGLNNPEGVNELLIKNGYEPCDYVEDCPNAIEFLEMEQGKSALDDILLIHPDYNSIINAHEKANPKTEPISSENIEFATPVVNSSIPTPVLSENLKEILIIIMAFWLLNKIMSS